VYKAPVVLICQNNQWAISTPTAMQCAADTLALKGIGYGVEALRVDGNDVLGVYHAVRHAADKARRATGHLPRAAHLPRQRPHVLGRSFALSRRVGDRGVKTHRDPIRRLEAYLVRRGWLEVGEREAIAQTLEASVRDAIARQEAFGAPALETLVDDVFEEPTWLLREQLAYLARSRARRTRTTTARSPTPPARSAHRADRLLG